MTFLGQHTVHELRELVAAKDVEMNDLVNAGTAYKPTWDTSDSTSSTQWQTDLTALQARYNTARTNAESTFTFAQTSGVSEDFLTAEVVWQAVLTALQQKPGVVTGGDLQDLYNRLVSVTGYAYQSAVPQPTAVDSDLDAFNDLQAIDPASVLLGDKADPQWWKTTKQVAKGTLGVAAVGVGIYALLEFSLAVGIVNTSMQFFPKVKE